MISALKHGFANYFNFSGSTARATFWWWVLANVIILFAIGLVDVFLINSMLNLGVDDPSRALSTLYSLAILIPNIAISVRRLHDIGRSGWWLLIGLVPIIGALILIYFYVQPSDTAID